MHGYYFYQLQMQRLRAAKKHKASEGETSFQRRVRWRELTKRRKRTADKQIIICVLTFGLLIVGSGVAVTCVGHFVLTGYNPMLLIGPVMIGCGVIVLLLSAEVCYRRKKMMQQVIDSEEDLKRYVNPNVVQYGYGHFQQHAKMPDFCTSLDHKRDSLTNKFSKEADASSDQGIVAVTSMRHTPEQRKTPSLTSEIFSLTETHSDFNQPKVSLTPASPTGPEEKATCPQVELLLIPGKLDP